MTTISTICPGLTESRADRRGNDYTSFHARSLAALPGGLPQGWAVSRLYLRHAQRHSCYLKDRVNSSQRNDAMVSGLQA